MQVLKINNNNNKKINRIIKLMKKLSSNSQTQGKIPSRIYCALLVVSHSLYMPVHKSNIFFFFFFFVFTSFFFLFFFVLFLFLFSLNIVRVHQNLPFSDFAEDKLTDFPSFFSDQSTYYSKRLSIKEL